MSNALKPGDTSSILENAVRSLPIRRLLYLIEHKRMDKLGTRRRVPVKPELVEWAKDEVIKRIEGKS